MKVSIFIRTYENDFPWIIPCLRSIEKYCSGFHEVVLHVDPDQVDRLGAGIPPWVKVVSSPVKTPNGYLNQQVAKLYADQFCEGDIICYHDSDCLFNRPNTPMDLVDFWMPYAIPRIKFIHTPYSVLGNAVPWQSPTELCLQSPVQSEFMRRFPMVFWKKTLVEFRKWFETTNRGPLDQWVARQNTFSEFNALGAWAFKNHHAEYLWINSETDPLPVPHVRQFWSHGGISSFLSEINDILNA